jgi:hypothetical protein
MPKQPAQESLAEDSTFVIGIVAAFCGWSAFVPARNHRERSIAQTLV